MKNIETLEVQEKEERPLTHIDLFAGVGGFSLAVDTVWPGSEHIFCDNDPFCQAVLKKHWPNSIIYGDIRELVFRRATPNATDNGRVCGWALERGRQDIPNEDGTTAKNKQNGEGRKREFGSPYSVDILYGDIRSITADSLRCGYVHGQPQVEPTEADEQAQREPISSFSAPFVLTGGFPCQPFSQAGRRKGTEDNRYLWPEMFRVIQLTKPKWVIAENVRGLVTWNDGLVLEQVCADLESEGYEVQPLIIPAVAVNAPHRRDRVWIVANRRHENAQRHKPVSTEFGKNARVEPGTQNRKNSDASDARQQYGGQGNSEGMETHKTKWTTRQLPSERSGSWNQNWLEVATRLCGVDARVSTWVDGRGKVRNSRNERLKALGNAIVPTVAEQIMLAIKSSNRD